MNSSKGNFQVYEYDYEVGCVFFKTEHHIVVDGDFLTTVDFDVPPVMGVQGHISDIFNLLKNN